MTGTVPNSPVERRAASPAERISLVFVIGSLLLLLITPLVVARRSSELRDRMDRIHDPARELITDAQFELAREMAALRGYLMTGDTVLLARYRNLVARQDQTMRELTAYADELGDEATAAMFDFAVRVDRWHSRASPGDPGHPRTAPGVAGLPAEQRLFEDALASATTLDQVVAAAARQLRDQISDEERRGLVFTFLLGILALGSVAVVVWFGARLRALAAVAGSRRREAEAALAETRRAAAARERLMRGVTHDVKNPLGAADGYAELLGLGLRGQLTPRQADTVEAIRRSIGSALSMIDDLLELSRAERGELPVVRQEIRLDDLVAEVVEAHRGAAESADLALRYTGPDVVLPTSTDPRRVEQVLSNLISNAIKYTTPGGWVDVRLDVEEDAGDPVAAAISVTDTGPGIPAEDRERVFLEFQRLHPRHGAGHGLGLAISRHIARCLGGDVTVDGDAGAGARFILRLPLRGPDAPE